MKYFLSLVFLVSDFLLCFGQQSIANPVSLGPILINQTNLDRMSELCQWYKLIEQPSDDGLRTYRHEDGTLIKFNISDDKTPYVEIHTAQSKKNIEKILTEAGYNKDKDRYIKGSIHAISYTTAQILGKKNKHVIFSIKKLPTTDKSQRTMNDEK